MLERLKRVLQWIVRCGAYRKKIRTINYITNNTR